MGKGKCINGKYRRVQLWTIETERRSVIQCGNIPSKYNVLIGHHSGGKTMEGLQAKLGGPD